MGILGGLFSYSSVENQERIHGGKEEGKLLRLPDATRVASAQQLVRPSC